MTEIMHHFSCVSHPGLTTTGHQSTGLTGPLGDQKNEGQKIYWAEKIFTPTEAASILVSVLLLSSLSFQH